MTGCGERHARPPSNLSTPSRLLKMTSLSMFAICAAIRSVSSPIWRSWTRSNLLESQSTVYRSRVQGRQIAIRQRARGAEGGFLPLAHARGSVSETKRVRLTVMIRLLFVLLAAAVAFAADDPPGQGKGTEERHRTSGSTKKGTAQPILAKFADVTADNPIAQVVKNDEIGRSPKTTVDRIDGRPDKASRITRGTKYQQTDPDPVPAPPGHASNVPSTSTSTSVGIGSKPDFELVYKRPSAPPTK